MRRHPLAAVLTAALLILPAAASASDSPVEELGDVVTVSSPLEGDDAKVCVRSTLLIGKGEEICVVVNP